MKQTGHRSVQMVRRYIRDRLGHEASIGGEGARDITEFCVHRSLPVCFGPSNAGTSTTFEKRQIDSSSKKDARSIRYHVA